MEPDNDTTTEPSTDTTIYNNGIESNGYNYSIYDEYLTVVHGDKPCRKSYKIVDGKMVKIENDKFDKNEIFFSSDQ